MKLYYLADPHDYQFAQAGRRGTWTPSTGACPICGDPRQRRIPPLVIEWLPDSERVGDFTWPGFNDEIVVSQRVRDGLQDTFGHLAFHPIEMVQDRRLKRPKRPTRRTKPRVWLPYQGPPLWDMQATAVCRLDMAESGVRVDRVCPGCGAVFYAGPPLGKRRLVVDKSTWRGEGIFRIAEFDAPTYCTEQAKQYIEQQMWTNVTFRLDGEVPDQNQE